MPSRNFSPITHSRHRHRRLVPGLRQEVGQRRGIEVEHLGAGEPPPMDVIQTQHLPVKLISTWGDPSLAPEDHDLVFARSHNAWIHPALRLGRLQRDPRFAPRWRLRRQPTCNSAVGERRRPVYLELGMDELAESLLIPLLDRAEDIEQQLTIRFDTHDAPSSYPVSCLARVCIALSASISPRCPTHPSTISLIS